MPRRFSEATRANILADYLNDVPVLSIAVNYGYDESYPGLLAKRRNRALRLGATERSKMAESARKRSPNAAPAGMPANLRATAKSVAATTSRGITLPKLKCLES